MTRPRAPLFGLIAITAASIAIAGDEFPPEVRAAAGTIHGRAAMAHIRLLADPHLEGREADGDGFGLAARYVQAQFESFGLSGGGRAGSFTDTVRLRYNRLGEVNSLAVVDRSAASTSATRFALGEDFLPFVFSAQAKVDAPLVFAGYGISAPEHKWDDYAGIDVRGAVVLVLRHEPRENDAKSVFKGKRSTRHAAFLTKARVAAARGAVALLVVTDPANHDSTTPGNSLARWPQLDAADPAEAGLAPEKGRPILADRYDDMTIPALHVSGRVASLLLAGSGRTLKEWQAALDEGMKPLSRRLKRTVEIETSFAHRYTESRNVIARLEGADQALAGQFVMVGAHLDHVGKDRRGQVHPGADDNASGTAGLLEVARALAAMPDRPRRTILFLSFTAEEMGLLGSYHFVNHPSVPLDGVVAILNLDMIGRNTAGQVNLVGKREAPLVHDRVVRASRGLGLNIKYDAGAGAARSDNFPFQTKGVPALSFFTGTHEDYHAPGDTADKIVPSKVEAIARLVFLSAWDLADDADLTPAATRGRR